MIKINDLVGISENRRKQAIECLDDLLVFKDEHGELAPVITGYNWYTKLAESNSVITFSNIHETEAYKQDMLKDLAKLGYTPEIISGYIRDKAGAYVHDLKFRIRGDEGNLLPGLRIKDLRVGTYLGLDKFSKPLKHYPQFKDAEGYLIAEDQGWELDVPFGSKTELLQLVDLFLRKSGLFLYDENGKKILETEEEKRQRAPWTDAYETPVLLLGDTALRYANELPHFIPATKMALKENSNEISFVVHKNLDRLRNLSHYEQLRHLGFVEECCLGNKPFIVRYVDKKR